MQQILHDPVRYLRVVPRCHMGPSYGIDVCTRVYARVSDFTVVQAKLCHHDVREGQEGISFYVGTGLIEIG